VPVDLPSKAGREAILEVHATGKPLADDVDFALLAESTAGLSGADLAEVVNEGAILAARAHQTVVTYRNLHDAVLRVLVGPEKRNAMLAEGELEIIAYHEAGHALAAELCPNHDKPLHATVRPRGRAGGFVYMSRTDRALEDADLIHERMVVALAGRAAEQTIFGKVSSGAANDLEQVNGIARQAVERLGLSPEVGQIISFNDRSQLSQEALGLVDRVVERFVHAAYEDALALLSENVESLERIAALLISQKDLERVDILSAISSPASSVKLQSGFGTRVERAPAARKAEREQTRVTGAEPVRVVRRGVRGPGGFGLRERLLGGARAAVAAAVTSQSER
jgi:cell division protease FtsH